MKYKVDYETKSAMQKFLDENPDNALDMSFDAMADISLAISDYRRENNLSQIEMANKLDVSQPMVSKIESGEYNFSIEFLCRICDKIGWEFKVDFVRGIVFKFEKEPLEVKIDYSCESTEDSIKTCKIYQFAA